MAQSKIYITRRNNSVYYYGIKNAAGKISWKSTGCKIKSQALSAIRIESIEPTPTPVIAQHTLSSYYTHYKAIKVNELRKTTVDLHDLANAAFINALGDKLLSEYTAEDIERFKNRCVESGKSATTINIFFRSIKAVFQHAVDNDYLLKSPFKFSKQLKIKDKKVAFMTREDIVKVLAVVKNQNFKDLFYMACLTGMRLSEIINLRWSAVDLENNIIRIENSDEFQTKTGKSRIIPVHASVKEILSRRTMSGNGYVFAKTNSYKYERNYISRVFKRAVLKAGLNPNLHFHSCRHTAASLLCASGVSIFETKEILGHSSVNLTANTYSHMLPSTLINSINRIQM